MNLNPWDQFNRWRESHFDILPEWLDDKDWKSWIWHTLSAFTFGHAIALLLWALSLALAPLPFGRFAILGVWVMAAVAARRRRVA